MLNKGCAKQAYQYLNGFVKQTPITKIGDVNLKLENEQMTGSYKIRGASYFINHLNKGDKVVTASAGNHAQGVAYAASQKGIEAMILMPEETCTKKVMNTLKLGARVELFGKTYDETARKAKEFAQQNSFVYIPAYEHPLTILGQGTVYSEFIEQLGEKPKSIAIPVGGGGLITGIALNAYYNGKTKIIGVQSEKANAMYNSFHTRTLKTNTGDLDTIAEGINVNEASEIMLEYILKYVDDMVIVSEEEIREAMRELYKNGIKAEGAGAVGYAAILSGVKADTTIITGGNIDKELFYSIVNEK